MGHSFFCKLQYVLTSPFQNVLLRIQGVNAKGLIYSAGLMWISRNKNSTIIIGDRCRFMSKYWGNKIGLYHRCMLSSEKGSCLTIGNKCSFSGVSIWCFESITLGNNVRVGANVLIMDGDAHPKDPRSGKSKPIVIGDNVWVGVGVKILKGVTIGENSLIGAGSIVTKNIPPNVVAAGNPCRVIRKINEDVVQQL